ncbi:unnamed protein product [Rotaria sordida]|uniref:Uncharacterized protein n=1 Tax=Rotaria sordida TaxID=392033 RepID=A0A814RM10_9BILA|nr:unnamed protein product [Rotaria sordida]CAF1135227.1 unnamed protein product [Rotaria sordida]CAF3667377.1 unnamed protein product [Rotaria sordida]CAF3880316.1 unnamed protein product [Rotaria sordida]
MPNSYYYFESSEVSHERLLLEIELLKQLQEIDLLHNLNWKFYDTFTLKIFLQAGIYEVNDELIQRYRNNSNEFEQYNFIFQCIQKHEISSINENFKQQQQQQQISFIIILNIIFIIICFLFIIGLFIYEYNDQYYLLKLLDHPLTTKRRQLSFTDDLLIILLTFITSIILGCIIIATRFNRKIILFGIITLFIIIILLIKKVHQIIIFLFTYREIRWPMLYDYMYS